MKCVQLLFVCWCCSILAVTRCIRVDGYACVSAYWDTVSCVLNISGDPVGQSNTSYSLKFTDSDGFNASCPLSVMNHSSSCVCDVTEGPSIFSRSDEYDIQLCHESGCRPVTKEKFKPSQNIQPTPPHKAEVQETPETLNITWKSGYEGHRYLRARVLDYQLLLQTSQSTESKPLRPSSQETSVWIQRSQLEPDATYCIRVRSIPKLRDYKGTWSYWSPATCWKNEAGEEHDTLLVILIKSLGPVCVIVGVVLFVFYSPAARMKIKTLSHTPSPAPFFQPLFQQHEGNLQEWLSPHGKFVLTYKTETLTTDEVMIVPKPITKEPEENQHFLNPPVTQLTLVQGQTSYVGLPGVHEASPPLTLICPRDTSYTQLPCSVWGVGIGEVEVSSAAPKGVFNISREDSGCEDLTPSPECSLPNSPADNRPPPCYSSNYCILKKTDVGFSPVLVSKGSSLNVPTVSLQEAEC